MQGTTLPAPTRTASPVITFAAVDADRMLLDGLAAWAANVPDLQLVAATTSVAQLQSAAGAAPDIVVLGLPDHLGYDPLPDIRALTHDKVCVLVLCSRPDDRRIRDTVLAGADGVVTRDNDLETLAGMLRELTAGHRRRFGLTAPPLDPAGSVPSLSEQERAVLLGYVSGLTLSTVARRVGIRPSTAKEYLHWVKLKYQQAGRPAYTKIDLANRVREDGFKPLLKPAGTPGSSGINDC
jgi:two-component system nitrate/nitrite response regulator NarL